VPRRPIRFPEFARGLILIVAAGAACGLAQAQSDTWWQLRAGQDIWHDHRIWLVDRYSYTASGAYWPDHEWLWQAIAYPLHSMGGMPLLAGVNGALAVGALLLVIPRGRTTRLEVTWVLLAIPLLSGVWSLRPQVASLFMLAVLLRQLRAERWWAVPVVMLLWANLHGAVATGGVVLVAACAAAFVTALRERSNAARDRVRALAIITLVSAAATLATPLGWRLWTYLLDSITRSRSNHIQEWQSAFHVSFFAVGFWCWLAVVGLTLALARRRIIGWPITLEAAVVIALAPFAITAIRNGTFFVLAALPLVISLTRRDAVERPDDDVPHGRGILWAVTAVIAVGVAGVWVTQPPKLDWHPLSPAAAEAIRGCDGHVYTTYYGGGFLIWFVPDVPVFVDNRQDPYPTDIIDLGALYPGQNFQTTFGKYDVRCAALTTTDSSSWVALEAANWKPTFSDSQWVVLEAP
jgi:hypothetical protein